MICLFGIDGSGKTTISMRIVNALASAGIKATYARPKFGMNLLVKGSIDPPPYRSRGVSSTSKEKAGFMNRAKSSILLIYFITKNLLAIGKEVCIPRLRRRWIVIERYWPDTMTDLVVDFGIPYKLARALSMCISMPPRAKYFFLKIEPNSAIQRKPGPYSIEYLEKRTSIYERVAVEIKATEVNTGDDPDESFRRLADSLKDMGVNLS